jgi:hypothetical protein
MWPGMPVRARIHSCSFDPSGAARRICTSFTIGGVAMGGCRQKLRNYLILDFSAFNSNGLDKKEKINKLRRMTGRFFR